MKKTLPDKTAPYISYGGHGIDVAIKRADDLDKLMLEHLAKKENPKVLDLGCGAGGHSVRMVEAGVSVTAIDSHDFSEEFKRHKDKINMSKESLSYIKGNINNLSELVPGQVFTDVYIQRTLHYLQHQQALDLLKFLYQVTEDRLYVSVTGLTSDVAIDHPGADLPVEKRFVFLDKEKAETFSIAEPVCLYSEDEFVTLLEKSGWVVERCWQSAFGNLKAICSHRAKS